VTIPPLQGFLIENASTKSYLYRMADEYDVATCSYNMSHIKSKNTNHVSPEGAKYTNEG